jgi:hypothetical protein
VLSVFGVQFFMVSVHGLDDQDYGGFGVLSQEGLMPSFALFQLLWICLYSVVHAEHVEA